ncbi:Pirin-like protein CC_3178 [Seminavis robusta]|uniref:Pirin-like protein CC_3178 n=1 Tax=Seminavis robusta TaxID=568900 RepID=A0A9N8E103_9STRA|nr:Pirin-like protein CC_3178 [Seminavis robusta]|eukprot:Sro440_g143460.1 Pirin-like protein CC_3178 (410) ;mRNA; r:31725-32954
MLSPRMLYRYLATSTAVLRSPASQHLSATFRTSRSATVAPYSIHLQQHFRRELSILTGHNHNVDSAVEEDSSGKEGGNESVAMGDQGIIPQESFEGKIVPLGPDFSVRRILPFRKQRSLGPFVFLDHFGPVLISEHAMNVGPHPHIGLMTISYLFEGAVLHRDSTGAEQIVLPGEVNGMISGKGVTHSERGLLEDLQPHLDARNVPAPTGSHGLQLWMALSKDGEDCEPSFHHGKAVSIDSHATLVVGNSNGLTQSSIPIDPKLGRVFYVDTHFENANDSFILEGPGGQHDYNYPSIEVGVYVSTGKMKFLSGWGSLDGQIVEPGSMVTAKAGATEIKAKIQALEGDTRVAILGGTPLPEKRHMFWNFVSAGKEKLDAATKAWDELDRSIFPKVVNEANDDSIPLPKRK